ncbi:regulatory protein, Fis family [Pseudomonas flavescens]|uniref:Regulatory protein, Fis family n=1 Tax=Phytopseudomonas flavescens TaxID=29435 RepID=A0A1G8DMH4_9GAMM|nr:sigma 54-interacting transcriptional regulator [Pseudomonas flavescens]SDH58699.1 regulatory protein, Fis family [Pseudomonas flavescens]
MESALELIVLENGISSLDVLGQSISELGIDILLLGETGTGKDTVARHLHKLSRPRGPFIAVNCAAIPESLFESELFGVSAGAFTGAERDRAGYFEAAHRGTLYLDEIDSMPVSLQVKLLRILESRQVERLGSTKAISLDIGIVASAQKSLEDLMERNLFRRDLYFRLNVMSLCLPPLRQRPERIAEVFRHLVENAEVELNMPAPEIDDRVEALLLNHDWPGNYRELKSAARRHVLGMPLIDDDPDEFSDTGLKRQLRLIEKSLIQQSLKRNDHCIAAVTSELDIPRRTLYQRMKDLDV